MLIFDYINSIYKKTPLPVIEPDVQTCLTISKWIGFDSSQISKVSKILPYIFYIEPIHYVYLLYILIDKKAVPYFKKQAKVEENKDELFDRITNFLHWSEREKAINRNIIKLAFKDSKNWKIQMGLK